MHSARYELLVPKPHEISPVEGTFELPRIVGLAGGNHVPARARERLAAALEPNGHTLVEPGGGAPTLRASQREIEGGPEAYELEVTPTHILLVAQAPAGFFHGLGTLAQLVSMQAGALRLNCVRIVDAPGFHVRGAMLDISRNRVPTMATLFHIVELLSSWKYNQLQLYTEHTFAYAGHEDVWRDQDPITPDEIRELDRYCTEHFIELVPNQQSFGHMHHWLRHARYKDLAEVPEGVDHPFGFTPEPFSLNPNDPRAFALLEDLYDQLLPCFSSNEFNVGLDETFDLGLGRSAEAVKRDGVDGVYLSFLKQVAKRVRARGKRMHFWADIVLNHPERVAELPEGVVPNLWGYEAHHPFDKECPHVASFGLDFIVCPGTSSWQTIGGRLDNMRGNIASAVRHAKANGALGLLITDWGDRGHLQPLPVSYAGWLTHAAAAWNPAAKALEGQELAELLSQHVFADPTGWMGRAWIDLARVGEAVGLTLHNASPLSILLTKAPEPFPCTELNELTVAGLERAESMLGQAVAARGEQASQAGDVDLLLAEHAWCERTMRFAIEIGRERLRKPGQLVEMKPELRARWKVEVDEISRDLQSLWVKRSRRGALEGSLEWFSRITRAL